MILFIHIENMAVIKSAELSFGSGFNVLTGETGAGKSILIDSINLLLGERTPRSVIRHGEMSATVSGLFSVPKSAYNAFFELGVTPEDDGTLLISRKIFTDGKNICRINGKITTVSVLKEIGRHLITIHGQHDNQLILDSKTHIDLLDCFAAANGGFSELKKTYFEKYTHLCALKKELAALSTDEDEKLRRMDLLKYEIDELSSANLSIDEEEELKRRRDIILGARELIKNVSAAHAMLYENDEANAYGLISSAIDCLADAAEIDPELSELITSANDALIAIEDISRTLARYTDNFDETGEGLDDIEARLDVIFKLKRKYGGTVASALKTLDELSEEYEKLTLSDERINELCAEIKAVEAKCNALSDELSDLRKKAAPVLENGINEALSFLDMHGAEFKVDFSSINLSSKGKDGVEFLISTNVGEPKKPLGKIISGGELSRIMLAIKSILPQEGGEPSMIFDEIDTGVSGRAAQKIAVKLSDLSKKKQILCVTHLAQIAAIADTHFLIEKSEAENKTFTSVTALSEKGRIKEIARIISGDAVTETTIKQAEEMLKK